MKPKKPILVTGSHRSGTTWVGSMIAQSPSVAYLHEPFNVNHNHICRTKFDYWYTYITDENGANIETSIQDTLNFRFGLIEELKMMNHWRDVKPIFQQYIRSNLHRMRKMRPLMKDPLALFSAPWLASKFDMDVIV